MMNSPLEEEPIPRKKNKKNAANADQMAASTSFLSHEEKQYLLDRYGGMPAAEPMSLVAHSYFQMLPSPAFFVNFSNAFSLNASGIAFRKQPTSYQHNSVPPSVRRHLR